MAFIGKTREFLLHLDASDETFQRAHSLRHSMTETEKILWDRLKNRSAELDQLGIKVLRFSNEQVQYNIEKVLEEINSYTKP